MTTYIRYPIETNPSTLAQAVYDYIKVRAPLWDENNPNLDVWIIQAMTSLAAELRELASDVPTDIFRFFGATMMSIPPQDATHSTVTARFTTINNSGYTIPNGTQVSIRDIAGNEIPFNTTADVIIAAGSTFADIVLTSTNTGADTAGLGANGVAATLLDTLNFVSTVILQGSTTGGVDAEDDSDYLDRLAVALRLLSTRPILPADFAIMARNVAGVYRAVAIDGYNPFHNLLTANEASIETDASGWNASGGTNTIARSTAQSLDGVASLALTSTAAGNSQAVQSAAGPKPAIPGDIMTASARFRAATVARSCTVWLQALDAANATITTFGGTAQPDTTSGWTTASVTAVMPANTVKVRVVVNVIGLVGSGETHYVDEVSLRRGTTTDWVAGGTPETGNARTIFLAAIDTLGNDVSGTIQTQIAALLQANREVNFIVNVGGAKRTAIAVTFSAKVISGYTTADVSARAVAAIQAYLSQATWGNTSGTSNDPRDWAENTTVRYSEVAQALSNVEGLDYWTALTIGIQGNALAAADIPLPGPAALATAGTITPTVT